MSIADIPGKRVIPMRNQHWTNSPKTVSIVVPMCNEEESIEILGERLELLQRRLGPNLEVEYCLVDDGSVDRTWELMESAVPQGARCVRRRHITNRGLGAAIRTGLEAASGSIVCTIDADCSYPPEDLSKLISIVQSGEADVAVASPYHPDGGVVGVKRWRIVLSRQCSLFYRCLSPLKLHTYTSIFRAYRGTVARQMEFESNGFVSAVEMLFCAFRLGYRIQEVPMVLRARERGYSKIRIARTIGTHLKMMASLVRLGLNNRTQLNQLHGERVYRPAEKSGGIPMTARLSKEDTSVG